MARLKPALAAALVLLAGPSSAGILPDGAFTAKAAGATGAAFLREPFGARAAAMGGASAACATGAEALFQNPAALTRFDGESPSEAAFGYDALLEGAYQGAAAYARPLGADAAWGAGMVYASQSPQTSYTGTGDSNGTFTPLDLAFGGGAAVRAGSFAFGGGLKAIRSSLADRSAMTAAADFGATGKHLVDLGEGPVDFGVALTNFGPPLKLGSNADPLPMRARAGGLWHASPTFDAALDLVFPVDQDPYASVGVESRFPASMVGSTKPWYAALRAGYDQNRSRSVDGFSGASFGAGLDMSALRLDFAFLPLGSLGSSVRVTFAARF
ncbi:MAG: PorV/PorQ family protein [Elusimicrobia bacterium]|nr:PorV/PorQ family protein [Elusimicrobiota bacterium]